MGQDQHLWELSDFPLFYYNQEAFKPEERAFKNELKKVQRLLKKNTDIYSEINTSLGIVETVFNSLIEGVHLDSQNMFDSMLGNTMPKREEKSALMTLKLAMDNFDQPLTHELLQHLHKTLLPEEENTGKYVGDMKIVEGNIYMGEEKIIHRGVTKDKVHGAMDIFIEQYNSCSPDTPLANAVKTHLHFETIHPFCDGNGRIGRTLMVMGLCRDLKFKVPLAISKTINKYRDDYYQQFKSTQQDCSLDISTALEIMSPLLRESLEETKEIIHISNLRKQVHDSELNDRQEKVMARLIRYELDKGFDGGLSNANYCKIAQCEPKVAQRDLLQLKMKGLLVKTGKLKGTRHALPKMDQVKGHDC